MQARWKRVKGRQERKEYKAGKIRHKLRQTRKDYKAS
jgi:hypothetical protein